MQQRPTGVTTEDIKAALVEARARVESGEEKFICYALPWTRAGYYLRGYIESAIWEACNRTTLENFIWHQTKDNLAYDHATMREYRLRYIDWMLDQ